MSTLSVTHVTGGDRDQPSRLSWIASHLLAFAQVFGAARRLAAAAEMGRPANPADLEILGVNGPLPRAH